MENPTERVIFYNTNKPLIFLAMTKATSEIFNYSKEDRDWIAEKVRGPIFGFLETNPDEARFFCSSPAGFLNNPKPYILQHTGLTHYAKERHKTIAAEILQLLKRN